MYANKFFAVIKNGDMSALERILSSGVDVNMCISRKTTPLMAAVLNQQTAIVRRLIDAKCNIEEPDGHRPLLSVAIGLKDPELITLLIDNGADVNNKDTSSGIPPLCDAARYGLLTVVEYMLKFGVNTLCRDDEGNTALHWAVQKSNLKMIQLLMRIGCPSDLPNNQGELPLHRAAKLGDLAVIWILIGSKPLFSDEPMSKEEIKLCLEAGRKNKLLVAASKLSSSENDTSLDKSERHCESEMKPIQDCGVNSRVEKTGATPLHYAIASKESSCVVDVVKLLIHAGADVNVQTTEGHTPLYIACSGNQTDCAKTLLKAGANPNIKGTKKKFIHNFVISDSGVLPLSLSAKHNNTELVQELINHGSLFSVAPLPSEEDAGDTVQDPLFSALFQNADGAAYCLLNNVSRFGKSFDVNTRYSLGVSYLMAVANCDSQQVRLAEKLLDLGCDINQQTEDDGDTALHHSINMESPDLVSVLLQHGADQNLTNVDSETPLHIAIKNGDMESLKLLLTHGADFAGCYHCPGLLPITLLMLAMDNMQFEIAEFLIDCGANLNTESYLFDKSYPGNREFLDRLYNEQTPFAEKLVAIGRNAPSLFCLSVRKIRSEFHEKQINFQNISLLPLPQCVKDQIMFKSPCLNT